MSDLKTLLMNFTNRGTMYHCTKKSNLKKILKEGIKPNKPKQITNAIHGVYLSIVPFDWMDLTTEKGKHAGLMIEIDVTDLPLRIDNGIDIDTWMKHPAFIYEGTIPVSRFKRISVSTKEKPNFFDDITEKIKYK